MRLFLISDEQLEQMRDLIGDPLIEVFEEVKTQEVTVENAGSVKEAVAKILAEPPTHNSCGEWQRIKIK